MQTTCSAKKFPAALAAALSVVLYGACATAGGFKVVFQDDFDGPELDNRKWVTRYIYADGTLDTLNDELENYTDNATHLVSDGVLSLVARPKSDASGRYESGMIRSRQTFYYGYFEARIRLPDALGIWPAFWLNPDYDADGHLSWPPEIDIFEYVINGKEDTSSMLNSSIKFSKSKFQGGGEWLYRDRSFVQKWNHFIADAPLNTEWQVVGALWKPDSVTVYLNGRKLYTRAYRWLDERGITPGPAHVLLNLAVGGNWPGRHGIEVAKFPQKLEIDYVRVCQYDSGLSSSERCAGSQFAPSVDEASYVTPVNDLARTRLISATVSRRQVRAGDAIDVKYSFDARRTTSSQQIRTTLVNGSGAKVALVAKEPPVPTQRWNGRQLVEHVLTVPKGLVPGGYQLLVAIGTEGKGKDRAKHVPLAAADKFGVADGRLSYRIADISVTSE